MIRILDLFAGLGGWSSGADPEDDVRTLDLDPRFGTTYVADILTVTPDLFGDWRPDLVLASPPCERFTVMQIGRNWHRGRNGIPAPVSEGAERAVAIVRATLDLIVALAPAYYVIENPRAMLRSLPIMAGLERRTVTYCQLGHRYMKPTDLWGGFPAGLALPEPCYNGAPCHVAAPSGSKTGIQDGSTPPAERALVPKMLSELVIGAARRRPFVPAALPILDGLYQEGFGWERDDRYIDRRPRHPDGTFVASRRNPTGSLPR